MKKLLFISNVCKGISNFHLVSTEVAEKLGYEFHFVANFSEMSNDNYTNNPNIHFHHIDIIRFPFSIGNIKAYYQLDKIIKELQPEVIHCNTPIGGVLGRLCGHKNKVDKIIYTAHGFHFYKGAPLINNVVYKTIERILAHYTDVLITMNEEDFQSAKKLKLKANGNVYKVNGVGINTEEYCNVKVDRNEYRKSLGLKEDDFVCIAMGDLIKRKNFPTAIKAIGKCNNSQIHYLICGTGPELENLKKLSNQLNVEKQIHFLGFRNDIKELLSISDCFLFTSLQEGLPRSLMEAMASGLPCIVSDIRGNNDLIKNGINGFLVLNINDLKDKILTLYKNVELRNKISITNKKTITRYDTCNVEKQILKVYQHL